MKLSTVSAALAIEIDPTAAPPNLAPLDKTAAEALAGAVAADLQHLLPAVSELGLVLAGGVYDQTQLLSPGFPIYGALQELYEESLSGGTFQPYCIALGAAGGAMPKAELQPATERLTGPLLIVPWLLIGPADSIADASVQLEELLVGSGQASAATALALNEAFGFSLVHAQYLTSNDLAAMLSLQLSNVGLPELWALLEAALFDRAGERWIETETGCCLAYHNGQVDVLFQSFDAWAASAGEAFAADTLAAQYAAYLRTQRQLTVTLGAHGVPVQVMPVNRVPADLAGWLSQRGPEREAQATWCEVVTDGPREGPVQITQHADPELGSVAFTVAWLDAAGGINRLENHYPLVPAGVPQLLNEIRDLTPGECNFSYPGQIVFDSQQRCLAPDPDALAPNWH